MAKYKIYTLASQNLKYLASKYGCYLSFKNNAAKRTGSVLCSGIVHSISLIVIHQYQQQPMSLGDTLHWGDGESATASRSHNQLHLV